MGSTVTPAIHPVYSHGGATVGPWASVAGNANGAGRPIFIGGYGSLGIAWPTIVMLPLTSAGSTQGTVSLTVFLEGHMGPVIGGVPVDNGWFDASNGGFAMTNTALAKLLSPSVPYWRTRIASYVSGWLDSFVGPIMIASGQLVDAQYPPRPSGGPPDFQSGY